MAQVLAFANQKGGVAKTTSTVNLGVALVEMGKRVLAVDMDPQGNLTMSQGIDPENLEKSMYDVLVHRLPIEDVIVSNEIDVAAATIDLAGAEMALSTQIGRERALEKALKPIHKHYDFVLIDTPPSLGLLTLNALTAADAVIVPLQAEYYALEGLARLLDTLERVRQGLNPQLELEGVLLTMIDARNNLSRQVADEVRSHLGERVFATEIPRNVRLSEAPSHGRPALLYDVRSKGSLAYLRVAEEILRRLDGMPGESR